MSGTFTLSELEMLDDRERKVRGEAVSDSKANLARRIRELEGQLARYASAINAVMLELKDPDRPVDRDQIWQTLRAATGSCCT